MFQQAFKRPEGAYAGSIGRPNQKCSDFSFLPTHSLLEICIEGVNVLALIDKIHAILGFNHVKTTTVDPGRYISITGDPLHIKCKINSSVKFRSSVTFPKQQTFYEGAFLVSSNIRHEWVLGLDFIAVNGLTLRAENTVGIIRTFYRIPTGHLLFSPKPPIRNTRLELSGVLAMDNSRVKLPVFSYNLGLGERLQLP